MALIGKSAFKLCTRAVSRRTFTTGRVLRCHPPGIPNDTLPFLYKTELSKVKFIICYIIFFSSSLSWPALAARDQAIRIGNSLEAAQDGDPAE